MKGNGMVTKFDSFTVMSAAMAFGSLAGEFVLLPETLPVFLKWLETQPGGPLKSEWTPEKLVQLNKTLYVLQRRAGELTEVLRTFDDS